MSDSMGDSLSYDDLQRIRVISWVMAVIIEIVGAGCIYGCILCCCPTCFKKVRPGVILSDATGQLPSGAQQPQIMVQSVVHGDQQHHVVFTNLQQPMMMPEQPPPQYSASAPGFDLPPGCSPDPKSMMRVS